MNETRRKPTTGTRCPTLFDKRHKIFYMPSLTDSAGHTKAFDYPVMDHWGHEADLRRAHGVGVGGRGGVEIVLKIYVVNVNFNMYQYSLFSYFFAYIFSERVLLN